MDGYHEYAGGQFDVQATRVDNKVTLSFYHNGVLVAQVETTRAGAVGIMQKIMGVLS